MMKSIFLSLVLVFVTTCSMAQSSDFGNWWIYFGNKQFNSKWNWHNEVQYRNYNFIGDLEQLLLRTGFGYNLTENNNNVLLGYGFILSENYVTENRKVSTVESRIYQQFITRQSFGKWRLQHRYRFEQRWVESDFSLRFRYFLALNYLLNNTNMDPKTWYLSAYNEIFLNTTGDIFDRNRLYGGLGYVISKVVRVEVAYMNQFFGEGGRDQLNLVAFVNF